MHCATMCHAADVTGGFADDTLRRCTMLGRVWNCDATRSCCDAAPRLCAGNVVTARGSDLEMGAAFVSPSPSVPVGGARSVVVAIRARQ